MTKEQMQQRLDGIEYSFLRTSEFKDLISEMKDANEDLVVVVGGSDDLCEIYGSIREEVGFYGDTTFYLDKNGVYHESVGEMPEDTSGMHSVDIFSNKDNRMFVYETSIPNIAKFIVREDDSDDIYCEGFVFSLSDL